MNALATATIPEPLMARVRAALAAKEGVACPGHITMGGQQVACRQKAALVVVGVAVFKCRRCGTLFAAGEAGA